MSDFSASNLYCGEDADDVASWDSDTWTPPSAETVSSPSDDDRPISFLLDSELHHMPEPNYLQRFHDGSIDAIARQDAVIWILKVHAHYRFRPVTAYLAVTYLDRFLSKYTLPRGHGWPIQLLSVACLSIAAKMEETCVPVLLDFQLFEPRFVFEPRTIRRMELLVMANLQWRLRSVTPFDFVDYFTRKLASFSPNRISSRASDLILCTHQDINFVGYRPSTVAAAAVLRAAGEIAGLSAAEYRKSSSFYESLSEEMVSRCQQLMEEYLIATCRSGRAKAPQSPAGVLDAATCGSCDTQKSASVRPEASRAEPPKKLPKLRCTETVETDARDKSLL
ncbi:cyclin-D2-1-like [Magnolia sinica]|uniref:cyclin-D2-1-like n=1 Tax=Magnolia sinica TaxID=86752 RepID=UPI002658768B|nr:cyclin-D2-1-like [Magnolia sinica]